MQLRHALPLALASLPLFCADARGQELIRDIHQGPPTFDSSHVDHFGRVGDLLFFTGLTPSTGIEPRVLGLTDSESALLLDIVPGDDSSFPADYFPLPDGPSTPRTPAS